MSTTPGESNKENQTVGDVTGKITCFLKQMHSKEKERGGEAIALQKLKAHKPNVTCGCFLDSHLKKLFKMSLNETTI